MSAFEEKPASRDHAEVLERGLAEEGRELQQKGLKAGNDRAGSRWPLL